MFQPTTALSKVRSLSKKIRGVQGGTSASKTISIEIALVDMAQRDEEPTLTSIVSESIPHLKRGAMRDFKNIMRGHGYWRDHEWNATDSIYTFPHPKKKGKTGSQIEFFSADQADKLRGGRRDRLFINEANNVTLDAFDQLEVRTREFVFLDWNPTTEFWFYTDVCSCGRTSCTGSRTDVEHIVLTYKDNEALEQSIIDSIESRKHRANWYKVYGMGELGDIEGRVYTGWKIIDRIPEDAMLKRRGLDFGYTNDPTAMLDIYAWNSGYIWDEVLYQKGMSNKAIADVWHTLPPILTVGDSSEPKSIDELKLYGVSIIGATKGPGSVNQGIQLVQDRPHWVTKRSVNLLREYRGYLWLTDKDGKTLNVPQDWDNHALDGGRYAESSLHPNEKGRVIHEFKEEAPLFAQIGL